MKTKAKGNAFSVLGVGADDKPEELAKKQSNRYRKKIAYQMR